MKDRIAFEDVSSFADAHAVGWDMHSDGHNRTDVQRKFAELDAELLEGALLGFDEYDPELDEEYAN